MDIIVRYKQEKHLYQNLMEEVLYTIKSAAEKRGIKYANLTGRVKSNESLTAKIKQKNTLVSLDEIGDLAGIRITCLFESEKQPFAELVEKSFLVVKTENKKESLGANQMGYQSLHYNIKLGPTFSGPRYDELGQLIAEIQITTVLLEAWSLINHTLVYKNESAVPTDIQRDINCVSSLLEVAQKVFDDSHKKRELYLQELSNLKNKTNDLLSEPINFDSLSLYSKQFLGNMPISEFWQNALINDIDKSQYRTLQDVHNIVLKAEKFISFYKDKRPDLFTYSTDVITKSIGFVDRQFRRRHSFSYDTAKAFVEFEKVLAGD